MQAHIFTEASEGFIGATVDAVERVATETAVMVDDVHYWTHCF